MPQRNRKLIPAAALLAILGAWLLLHRAKPDLTLIAKVSASRIAYAGAPTRAASLDVAFTRKDDAYPVANVAIDLNQDGKIAPYAVTGGTQEEWVVRNARAKAIEGSNAFTFELVDADVATRNNFRVVAMLTGKPVQDWNGKVHAKSAALETTLASFAVEDFGDLFTADPQNGGSGGIVGTFDVPPQDAETPAISAPREKFTVAHPETFMVDASASGGDVPDAAAVGAVPAADAPPAAGSDFEVFQPGVPDRFQGHNECVPSSISNGLTWLSQRYGFEDKMPPSQEDTLEELKPLLHWRSETGANMRDDVLPAKVAFTERHGLPIVSHRIGDNFDPDIVRKIAVELRKGQAVEIALGYYTWNGTTRAWERHGGHMVSGVGAFGMNGKTYLGLHDPLSPESGALDMYNVDGSKIYDYRYRGDTSVFIEWAYAQSPTDAWVKDHPPSTSLDASGLETRNLQDVWFVPMLRIGTAWYPVRQFHEFTGQECDRQEHWHANTGTAWGLEFRNHGNYFETNPERVVARSAPVTQWTDPEGCGAGKTSEVERFDVMVSRSEAGELVSHIVQ